MNPNNVEKQNKIIGKFLKTRREEMGLSQLKLSKMTGIHRTSIICWEQGKYTPPLLKLLTLCQALYADPIELIEELEGEL